MTIHPAWVNLTLLFYFSSFFFMLELDTSYLYITTLFLMKYALSRVLG
jgi:hypothetical protein